MCRAYSSCFQIHSLSLLIPVQGHGVLQPVQHHLGVSHRKKKPWTGRTSQDQQSFTLTFKPMGNFERPVPLTCVFLECGNKTNTNSGRKCKPRQGRGQESNAIFFFFFALRGNSANSEPLCWATARKFITDLCQHIEITHVEHSFSLTVDFCAEGETNNAHFHLKS